MNHKVKVLVDMYGRRIGEIFSVADKERLHAIAEVVWERDEAMPADQASESLETAEVLICSQWRYGELKGRYPNLRAVIDVGGGLPRLDYEEAFARGIQVLTASPGFARQVAEAALGLALASAREIPLGDRRVRERRERYLHAGNETTFMLYGKPVGFIGYGAIARALQPLLQPFGGSVLAYDPWLGEGYMRHSGVEPTTLEDLLERSRFIFVLAAPSSENAALLDRALLERISPDSVLVLISRAHVVDFDAMTDLLAQGRFRAAIDVFPIEPLPEDHPIRDLDNVVLSAHRAGSVREGMWDLGELVVDDLELIARRLPTRRLLPAARETVRRLTS
jgi:phosphoglycerate dehydrogenase-like enzyme